MAIAPMIHQSPYKLLAGGALSTGSAVLSFVLVAPAGNLRCKLFSEMCSADVSQSKL